LRIQLCNTLALINKSLVILRRQQVQPACHRGGEVW